MRIHVISTRRATERRAAIEGQMAALGLDFAYHDAFDWRENLAEAEAGAAAMNRAAGGGAHYTKGMYACTRSHRDLRRRVAAAGVPALILEDDARFRDGFALLIDAAEAALGRVGVALLSYYTNDGTPLAVSAESEPLPGGARLRYPARIRTLASGLAYAVTPEAAATLAEEPIAVFSDDWGRHHRQGTLPRLGLVTPLGVEGGPFPSLIDYGRGPRAAVRRAVMGAVRRAGLLEGWRQARHEALQRRREAVVTVDEPPYFRAEANAGG